MIPSEDFEDLLRDIADKLSMNEDQNETAEPEQEEPTSEFKEFLDDINAVIDPRYEKYNFIGIAHDPETNQGNFFYMFSGTRGTSIVLVQRIMHGFYKVLKDKTTEQMADMIMMLMAHHVITGEEGTPPKASEIAAVMFKMIMHMDDDDDKDGDE